MPTKRHRRLQIVITAGPTREFLDTVRFLSNPSSGRMGYAVAAAAARSGHEVTLISGPVELPSPRGVSIVRVETAAEMLAATRSAFRDADGAIFAAAVCDYRAKKTAHRKLPKSRSSWKLELVPTPDIAATLGRAKGRRVTIAFALEDHDARRHAEAKLKKKNCDAILLNGPENIGAEMARFELLIHGEKWRKWPAESKAVVARRIIQVFERLAAAR